VKTTNDTIGRQGRLKGGVLSFGLPRSQAMTMDGMTLSPAQGVEEAINFEGAGAGKAGHHRRFRPIVEEVNPVISALEEHHITVTALPSHMLTEQPRLFFMHFWAVVDTKSVAEGIRAALTQIAIK
jgi:hypothetical protein